MSKLTSIAYKGRNKRDRENSYQWIYRECTHSRLARYKTRTVWLLISDFLNLTRIRLSAGQFRLSVILLKASLQFQKDQMHTIFGIHVEF